MKQVKALVKRTIDVWHCPHCGEEVELPQAAPRYPSIPIIAPTILGKPSPKAKGVRLVNSPTPVEKRIEMVKDFLNTPGAAIKDFADKYGVPYATMKTWIWQYNQGYFNRGKPVVGTHYTYDIRSDEEKDKICHEYFDTKGVSIRDIAKKHGLSRETLRNWLRKRSMLKPEEQEVEEKPKEEQKKDSPKKVDLMNLRMKMK